VKRALTRRELFELLGGAAALAACRVGGAGPDAQTTCSPIPREDAGADPADGSNGPDVLTTPGVVRSDITASFGGAVGVAGGLPLTVSLTFVNDTCQPTPGRAVYLWHANRDGDYSMYSPAIVGENYLRGVQVTDADGKVTFATIFPGCEVGRWPSLHLEIFASEADATSGVAPIATTLLAMPAGACASAYAQPGYLTSRANFAHVSLAQDPAFVDGYALQLPLVVGYPAAGYTATLEIEI
jgi:hypothetical protein